MVTDLPISSAGVRIPDDWSDRQQRGVQAMYMVKLARCTTCIDARATQVKHNSSTQVRLRYARAVNRNVGNTDVRFDSRHSRDGEVACSSARLLMSTNHDALTFNALSTTAPSRPHLADRKGLRLRSPTPHMHYLFT